MDDYVSKPVKADELYRVIERQAVKSRKGSRMKKERSAPGSGDRIKDNEIFNETKALEVVDGDRDLLKEIIELFLGEHLNDVERLTQGVESGDAHTVERSAHSLKGSVASLGAKRAQEAAYRLERIGKEGRLGEAEAATAALKEELERLVEVLNGYLRDEGTAGM
ncbi:MAG: Hpt domain-containing protein [Deltaproteobacteria bacterium]|nr:Hpt domain-containing protein [Deltaproteobacteria bacterium]